MIARNTNQYGLTDGQTNAFLSIWGRINQESRVSLSELLRMLVRYRGNRGTKTLLCAVIQVIVHHEDDSKEHVLAAEEFVNVMFSLPSGGFPLMSALADRQLNQGLDQQREGQIDERVGNRQTEQGHPAGDIACDTDESSNISLHLGSSGNTPMSETASMTGITSVSETTSMTGITSMSVTTSSSEDNSMSVTSCLSENTSM
jgi:hypothetical protein